MGNCLKPNHKKKSTAEIAPSDLDNRYAATTSGVDIAFPDSYAVKPAVAPPSTELPPPLSDSTKLAVSPPAESPPSSLFSAINPICPPSPPSVISPSSNSAAINLPVTPPSKPSHSTVKYEGSPPRKQIQLISDQASSTNPTLKQTVLLYGHPTSSLTYYLRYLLQQKPISLEFFPTIFELSLFTLEFGKGDVVSGSVEDMLSLIDARFPDPPLMTAEGKAGILRRMVELQHRSVLWHLEKMVKWASDLAVRGGKASVDPGVGTPRMEVRKFGRTYGQLLDVMLEHARMEEMVVFPILMAADRGLCKIANEEHGRDLPIMNGIKEALKSIVVLDAGTADHREALYHLSSRLEILQENCREHFEEEELNVLPLLGAMEMSKEQQKKALRQCIIDTMQGAHSHLFRFFVEGLRPHEALQYMNLILHCIDEEPSAAMFRRLVEYED